MATITTYDVASETKGPQPAELPPTESKTAADKPVEQRWDIEVPPGYQGEVPVGTTPADAPPVDPTQ